MKYLAITAVLCLILAGASFAGNVTITEVLTGGNLTLTMPENFSLPSATLGGSTVITPATTNQTYTVEDARGTGAGWNLGFQCSQFTASGTPARTIPASTSYNQVKIQTGNITKVWGQNVDDTNGPKPGSYYDAYRHIPDNTEYKIVTCATDYGMGKYNISCTHLLQILAYAYAGTYTATLTATLNNVP